MHAATVPVRPFGQPPDLDLDFGRPDRPALVTELLAGCCAPADANFWWDQSVSLRTATLLRLAALTDGRDTLPLHARCTACGEMFGFDLPLRQLADYAAGDEPLRVALGTGRAATLRRPTGTDLRRWREARPATREAAVTLMIGTLLVEGDGSPDDEAALAPALAALDPLVDFTVACACPACGAGNDVALDLEALALGRLAASQRTLLEQIHICATHYGWTEAQVLAVPPARRARYLAMIGEER
ncbi:hypothetical protein [Massilia sp. METH4]|uniref:hypothetical protein n=1 Tax=Massilia sp. METH4 TaxID=3123041 RepID=UPI0030D5B4B5